jgi:hypothetical protein
VSACPRLSTNPLARRSLPFPPYSLGSLAGDHKRPQAPKIRFGRLRSPRGSARSTVQYSTVQYSALVFEIPPCSECCTPAQRSTARACLTFDDQAPPCPSRLQINECSLICTATARRADRMERDVSQSYLRMPIESRMCRYSEAVEFAYERPPMPWCSTNLRRTSRAIFSL